MEIHFLGTGSCNPAPHRGASCTVLRYNKICWMFDCGEGTQTQLMKSQLKPGRINKIFITHLHGDHLFGLPGLLCTLGQNVSDEKKHIDIFGPVGLREYVRTCLGLSQSLLGYSYAVHEIDIFVADPSDITCTSKESKSADSSNNSLLHPNEVQGTAIRNNNGTWLICQEGDLTVYAAPLRHRITCYGFVIQEKDQVGKLDAALLKTKGIPPGPLYAKIKLGETITAPDGSTINPEDVTGPSRPGRKVVILGDTCDSSAIVDLACNADCIVHEATHEDEMREMSIERGHSTPEMAGTFARRIQARQLILTHFSQRYKNTSCEDSVDSSNAETITKLVDQAKQAFLSDNVIGAEDLTHISIPVKR